MTTNQSARAGGEIVPADRRAAVDATIQAAAKSFGPGSVMRMGEQPQVGVSVIPTGTIGLDLALGVGGLPRGRVIELFGPESSGKCLVGDTRVWTDRGLETIEEIFARADVGTAPPLGVVDVSSSGIRVVNEEGNLEPVMALTRNGDRPVRRITLASGRAVGVTLNHPLRVLDIGGRIVWREAVHIRLGDHVVSACFGAMSGESSLTIDEAAFLGHLVANAVLSVPGEILYPRTDSKACDTFARLARAVFGDAVAIEALARGCRVKGPEVGRRLVDDYGIDIAKGWDVLPERVRHAGPAAQDAFLDAYLAARGTRDAPDEWEILVDVDAEPFARDMQLLALGLGTPTVLETHHDYFVVSTTPAEQFWDIPTLGGVVSALGDSLGFDDALDDHLAHLKSCDSGRLAAIIFWAEAHGAVDHPVAGPLLARLVRLATAEHTYETVTGIADLGERPTYDLVVPGSHSFIANGMLSHNTTLALAVVAECQRNGGICAYVDAEQAMDPVYARAIGVDVDEMLISQPDSGEQALDIVDLLARSASVDVVVIDSVAALVPRAELEGDMGQAHVGLQARLMSQALRKLTATLNRSGTTALFINQLREKIGSFYGPSETTPGGRALKFYASVRIDIRRIKSIKVGDEVVGNLVRAKVAKNKVGPPLRTCEFEIGFGRGIDQIGSLFDEALSRGLIDRSGNHYRLDGQTLGNGKANAVTALRADPGRCATLDHEIRAAAIGVPITPWVERATPPPAELAVPTGEAPVRPGGDGPVAEEPVREDDEVPAGPPPPDVDPETGEVLDHGGDDGPPTVDWDSWEPPADDAGTTPAKSAKARVGDGPKPIAGLAVPAGPAEPEVALDPPVVALPTDELPEPEPELGGAIVPPDPEPAPEPVTPVDDSAELAVRSDKAPIRALIIEILRANGGKTYTSTKLAKELGRSSGAVGYALGHLVDSGDVVVAGESPRSFRLAG